MSALTTQGQDREGNWATLTLGRPTGKEPIAGAPDAPQVPGTQAEPGQTSEPTPPRRTTPAEAPVSRGLRTHIVAPGETFSQICSEAYPNRPDNSLAAVMRLVGRSNELPPTQWDTIQAGQELVLPDLGLNTQDSPPSAAQEPEFKVHVVKPGETFSQICDQAYPHRPEDSLQEIMRQVGQLNGLSRDQWDRLHSGQKLRLPPLAPPHGGD